MQHEDRKKEMLVILKDDLLQYLEKAQEATGGKISEHIIATDWVLRRLSEAYVAIRDLQAATGAESVSLEEDSSSFLN